MGAPQILHFKQIIAIARREGYTADFRHITFGSILGEDRKLMKTRSGENVALRDLLDEAVQRARKIIEEKNPDLSEPEKADIAQKVGIGAVKYYDLSQYRMTDYIFSWDGCSLSRATPRPICRTPMSAFAQSSGRPAKNLSRHRTCLSRAGGKKPGAKALPVCRGRAGGFERFPSEHPGELPLRVGERLPRVLRSVSRSEIGRAGPQLASRALRIDGAGSWEGARLARIKVPEKM